MTGPDRIPAVLERVDLVELVTTIAGQPVATSGGTVTFRCPNPGHPDQHPSFKVRDGRWRCWSQCGSGGDAIDLLVWHDKITKADAIERLAAKTGLQQASTVHDPSTLGHPPTPTSVRSTGRDDDVMRQFLQRRCWDLSLTEAMGLHLVRDTLGKPWVRFPWPPGPQGESWHQDRRIGEGSPKWLSSPDRIPWPYRADLVASARSDGALIVCEGPSDVVAMLHGLPDENVIGIPGSNTFKPEWAAGLAGLELIVITDNDAAGENLRKTLNSLNGENGTTVHNLYVPAGLNDVDEWRRTDLDGFPDAFHEVLEAYEATIQRGVA